MSSDLFGADMEKLWPISYEGQSDSACFDNALELLQFAGYPLPHAMMMMIPEAWAGNPLMDENRRAFYEYHAALMEPWDGPAAIAFTNGRQIGATLDRNGLRPARYLVTDDGFVMLRPKWACSSSRRKEHHPQVAAAARQDAAHRP
jgi:glutamate synthase (NADPH/NADH) large chain